MPYRHRDLRIMQDPCDGAVVTECPGNTTGRQATSRLRGWSEAYACLPLGGIRGFEAGCPRFVGAGNRMSTSYRCVRCRNTKAKCSGQYPCERCFRLCVACEPPDTVTHPPGFTLAVHTADAYKLTRSYMEAFVKLHAAGEIETQCALPWMSAWRAWGVRCGVDVTYGVLSQMCARLSVTYDELEGMWGGEEVIPGTDESANIQHMADQLLQTPTFKALKAGGIQLKGWPQPQAGTQTREGRSPHEHRRDMFCDTQEANRLSSEKKLPMEIAGSSMISPEDHARYFELLVRVTMSRQSAGSDLLKVAVGNNEVCLCIYRLQSIRIPELGDAIGWTARWERAPPSRHVNMRPGHRHRVVNTFRQSGGSHTMGDTESSSAGTGPSSAQSSPTQDIPACMAIPGVASIPLPPIQTSDIERLMHVAQTVGMPARASPKLELQPPAPAAGGMMRHPQPRQPQQQQQQRYGACVQQVCAQQQQWHHPPHDAGGGGGGGGGMAPYYEADDDRFMLDDETLDMLLDTTREHT